MKKGLIIAGAIILIVVIIIAIFSGVYNTMVQQKENVKNAYSVINVQLQRRYDLIPNLVNTVKGYSIHEQEILNNIANARTKIGTATNPTDRLASETELSSALSRLLVVVENYPDLKADANFRQLSDELAGTENRIAVARKDYNDNVTIYNRTIKSFPNVIFAGMYGFTPEPYFEAAAGAAEAPKVQF